MMHLQKLWVLFVGAILLQGCYRSTRMDMLPYTRPYLQASRSGSATQRTTPVPQVATLTPKTLVFHVLHNNATLRWLRQSQKVARANVSALSPVSNPELRVMGLSGALASGDVSKLGVRLRWNPPFPTVHAAKQDQARAEAQIQEQRLWAKTYQLLAEAQKLYQTLQALSARLDIEKQSLLRAQQAWRWETKRQALERATALQVSAKRLAFLQQQSRLQQLIELRQQTKSKLVQLMGVQGPCRLSKRSFLQAAHRTTSPVPALIAQALQRSPTLATLRNMYRAQHAKLWVEKTKRIPWISFFQFSYEFNESPWPNGFEFGIGIKLPVFTWNTGSIHKQNVQIRAIQAQTRVHVAQIVLRVRSMYQRWSRLNSSIQTHQQVALRHIQATLTQLKVLKKQPGTTLEQSLKLEEDISRLKLQYIQQTLQLQHAQIDLSHHTYSPIWEHLGIKLPKS